MVHWTEPAVVLSTLQLTEFALCVLLGVLVWEVVTSLRLDWATVAGKRRFSAAYIPYAVARVAGIASLLATVVVARAEEGIDCSAWSRAAYICAYIGTMSADGISLLRTLAVSSYDKWAVGAMSSFYAGMGALMIYEHTKMKFARAPSPLGTCVGLPGNQARNVAVALSLVAFDFLSLSLFMVMLRRGGTARQGLWKLLYHQGVVWFISIAVTHITGMTLLILDLNQPISVLSQMITTTVIVICATRMHRGLTDYFTKCSHCSRTADSSAPSTEP